MKETIYFVVRGLHYATFLIFLCLFLQLDFVLVINFMCSISTHPVHDKTFGWFLIYIILTYSKNTNIDHLKTYSFAVAINIWWIMTNWINVNTIFNIDILKRVNQVFSPYKYTEFRF